MIADLHIHSRFSRATSQDMNLQNLVKWAKIKGVRLLGTGDFTHPAWLKELKELKEKSSGIYYYDDFPFLLSAEICLIYKKEKEEKTRKVHLLVLAPSFSVVEQINSFLSKIGNLEKDGRPIFNITCEKMLGLLDISKEIEIIPAHAWTSWHGIFGSMSGFDSLEEAFGEGAKKINAIETGMSSDPEMNWRVSFLNEKSIISFSDAHSTWPWRLGREATIFDINTEVNYKDIIEAIRKNKIRATIETPPAYGKYHYDGHRFCNFSCSPKETEKIKKICPICKKPLTIGVLNRVETLADQDWIKRKNRKPFYSILPLHELISSVKSCDVFSKKTWQFYNKLIEKFGNEFNILLNVEKEKIAKIDEEIAQMIMQNRIGNIKIKAGYDGKYGIIEKGIIEKEKQTKQMKLF